MYIDRGLNSSGYFNSANRAANVCARSAPVDSYEYTARARAGVILFSREYLGRKSHRDVPRCAGSNQRRVGSQTDRSNTAAFFCLPPSPGAGFSVSSDTGERRTEEPRERFARCELRRGTKKYLSSLNFRENDPYVAYENVARKLVLLIHVLRISVVYEYTAVKT